MGLGAFAAFVVILYLGRNLSTFLYDEWSFVLNRRGWSLDTFLVPHNEHLSAAPVLVFKLLFKTVGASPYWPYRVVVALLTVGIGVLVYVYAVPRLGREVALVPGLLTVLVGAGGQDIIWPFQIGFGLSVLGGLVLLLCLDRRTAKAEWWASGAILLALASSGIGIAVLAAGGVDVALHPARRRRGTRILALPVLLYGAWYVNYNVAKLQRDNLLLAPQYLIDSLGGAVGALIGLSVGYYSVLAIAFVALVTWGWMRTERPPLRLVTVLTLPLAFWLLTAVGRAEDMQPTTSRYLLPGAVFVALVACEALRGVRVRQRAALPAVVLVLFSSVTHVFALRVEAKGQFNGFTSDVRAELAALSLAREAGPINPRYVPDPVRAPDIVTGRYFAAIEDVGNPIPDPVGTLARSFLAPRQSADAVYVRALDIRVRSSRSVRRGGPRPVIVEGEGRPVGSSCVIVRARRPVVFVLPPGGLALRTSGARLETGVGLRRWGAAFYAIPAAPPGRWGSIVIGHDREHRPVEVQFNPPKDGRACGLPGA
jgi:hypothetical protein